MAKNSFFESNNYPTIMFLVIIIFSIVLLFSFVDFVDDVDKGFTAYAIQEQNITNEETITQPPIKTKLEGEAYTIQAWGIYYISILIIIILVTFLSIVLKNTIKQDITKEDSGGIFTR